MTPKSQVMKEKINQASSQVKTFGPGVIQSYTAVLYNGSLLSPAALSPTQDSHSTEDSVDNDMSPVWPQKYLFSYEANKGQRYHFKVDNDENEHQLPLRMVSFGADAKDVAHC